MGCGCGTKETPPEVKEEKPKEVDPLEGLSVAPANLRDALKKEHRMYHEKKRKLENVFRNNLDFFKSFHEDLKQGLIKENDDLIEHFFNKHNDLISKNKIKKEDLIAEAGVSHAEDILEKEFDFKNWEIHGILKKVAKYYFPETGDNVEKLNIFFQILEKVSKYFPKDQTGLVYHVPTDEDDLVNSMNLALKMNEKFNKNLVLNLKIKSNNENKNIYKELGEVIEFNCNLITLVVHIKFIDSIEIEKQIENFNNFTHILEAIKNNTLIKALVIIFEDIKFLPPDNINKLLFELISSNRIFALFINGYPFNLDTITLLFESLIKNNKLLLFGLHLDEAIPDSFKIIGSGLSMQNSLQCCLISGTGLTQEEINYAKTKISQIKVLEFLDTIK